ncbi:MAG: class I SAM-dependent methyltransferase [bacterium]|nr:class I SAM-dependent methyltransferase [bacterium]MDD5756751.1 class I SAM-dependent methyltransferase [bacterium]
MSSVFNKYYKKYDFWYDTHQFAFMSELQAIKNVFPKNRRSLEIGVGTGRFAAALKITIGIDPSLKMLRLAEKRGLNVYQGFGENIPFLHDAFDCVLIIITLCFVDDPKKVIAEAARVLKKNGRIIIGIVDKNSFLGKYYQRKKSIFYKQAKFISVKEVTDLLKNTGFGSINYQQTISVRPEKMERVEKPKKGYGQGGFVIIAARKGFR